MTKPKHLQKPVDPRHAQCKAVLAKYWAAENPALPELPWSAAAAGALGELLRSMPTLTVAQFTQMLRNRLKSDDHAAGEPVFLWLRYLTKYAAGPLDKYKQPKETPHGQPHPNRADLGNRHAAGAAEAAIARLRGVAGDRDR